MQAGHSGTGAVVLEIVLLVSQKSIQAIKFYKKRVVAGMSFFKEYLDLIGSYLPSCADDLRAILFITPWIVTSSCDPVL